MVAQTIERLIAKWILGIFTFEERFVNKSHDMSLFCQQSERVQLYAPFCMTSLGFYNMNYDVIDYVTL